VKIKHMECSDISYQVFPPLYKSLRPPKFISVIFRDVMILSDLLELQNKKGK
jgi:hypothetical protein